MDQKIRRMIREVRPGVWGLTNPVWRSEPFGAFYVAVWYNFLPEPEFVITFRRRDKKPLVDPETGRLLPLSPSDKHDLWAALWPAMLHRHCCTLAEENEPYALLKRLGIRIGE